MMNDFWKHLATRLRMSESRTARANSTHIGRCWWVDSVSQIVTFPLWNLSGQLVGYQQYNWGSDKKKRNDEKGRYWTYHNKNNIVVWGLEHVRPDRKGLYITEGIWDAISVMATGRNAIAVLTNNPKHLRNWLSSLPQTTVAVCQGDVAGKKLANLCDYAVFLPDGEDAGSLPLKDLNKLLEE